LALGLAPEVFREILETSATRPIPLHNMATLRAVLPFSRYGRFMMGARGVVFRLVRRHAVPVDPEIFFLCSVMHSVDHYCTGRHTHGINVALTSALPVPPGYMPALFCAVFTAPTHPWIGGNLLRTHRRKNPFYAELYAELGRLDQEFADQVTLSVSF
jgi:hypothetical protein